MKYVVIENRLDYGAITQVLYCFIAFMAMRMAVQGYGTEHCTLIEIVLGFFVFLGGIF